MTRVNLVIIMLIGISVLFGCRKEKVPVIPVPEPTKWELISGSYKVYDTMGVFLYDMNIVHVPNENLQYTDSLRFENFDGEFDFVVKQSNASNFAMSIGIGVHNLLFDSNNKRWKLGGAYYEDFNIFKNDTILLRFQKTNINYWLEDLVPYYECDCKQIAVKQH